MQPGQRTSSAIKTWRYLRLSMIVLIVGLAASIGYERWKTSPGCFPTSISAYYYTPVHGVLVGTLVGVGVCLVCLRGNTDAEDILLNLAGMFAALVALVPIPNAGSCASVLETTRDRDLNIANNVVALLVLGAVALLISAVLTLRSPVTPRAPAIVGLAVAVAAWLLTALVFAFARGFFVRTAHYTSAVLMFGCVLAVVILNAVSYTSTRGARAARNRYSVIAAAIVLVVAATGLAGALGWRYWILAVEAGLIALFAAFWAAQTQELWYQGLR